MGAPLRSARAPRAPTQSLRLDVATDAVGAQTWHTAVRVWHVAPAHHLRHGAHLLNVIARDRSRDDDLVALRARSVSYDTTRLGRRDLRVRLKVMPAQPHPPFGKGEEKPTEGARPPTLRLRIQ